jgi:gluconate 2-dehydrogenase gamma chain
VFIMNWEFTRRETLIQLMRAGALGTMGDWMSRAWALDRHLHGAAGREEGDSQETGARQSGPYEPLFFNRAEYSTVRELAALIIPTDESPGAREAHVEEWIDFILSQSDAPRQAVYRQGMAYLENLCRGRHAKRFEELSKSERTEILRAISEEVPETEENRSGLAFFRALKHDTIVGFYTSEIGLKELDYKGNTFYSECPGCDHPEHLNLDS